MKHSSGLRRFPTKPLAVWPTLGPESACVLAQCDRTEMVRGPGFAPGVHRCPVALTELGICGSSHPPCCHQGDNSTRDSDPHRAGDSGGRRSATSRPRRDRDAGKSSAEHQSQATDQEPRRHQHRHPVIVRWFHGHEQHDVERDSHRQPFSDSAQKHEPQRNTDDGPMLQATLHN